MTVTVLKPTLSQLLNFVQNNSIHLPMNAGAEKLPKVEVQLLSGIVVNYSGELFDLKPHSLSGATIQVETIKTR